MQGKGREGEPDVHDERTAPADAGGERVADGPEDGGREAAEERDLRHGTVGAGPSEARDGRERRVERGEPHREPEGEIQAAR